MRKILIYTLAIFLASCTKDSDLNSVTGKWTLTEIRDDVGLQSANDPDCYIDFKQDGRFLIHPNGLYNHFSTALDKFDRYIVQQSDSIRFYNSSSGQTTTCFYSLNGGLFLSYGRCGEKFSYSH